MLKIDINEFKDTYSNTTGKTYCILISKIKKYTVHYYTFLIHFYCASNLQTLEIIIIINYFFNCYLKVWRLLKGLYK